MIDDLFGDDEDIIELKFAEETEYGVTPADSDKVVIADAAWHSIALAAAKNHGYAHCLLGHVTCPFTEEGEEPFAAAWYQGRDIGWNEYITEMPKENLFGSQFEKGM